MRYITNCILITLLFSGAAAAQDTAWQRIMAMKEDTGKIEAMAKYAKSFLQTDRTKSQTLHQEVIRLSHKLDAPAWAGYAWLDIGYINGKEGRDRAAIDNFNTAMAYYKKANKPKDVARCLINIGICYDKLGDMDRSINFTLEAIQVLENTEHKAALSTAYNSMGTMFYNLLNYNKAEEYFKRTITVAKEIKDTGRLIYALLGAGASTAAASKFKDAYQYADEAMKLAKASGQDFHLCLAHECMAEVSLKAKRATPAIIHAHKALQYARAAKDAHQELAALVTLTDSYGLANDHKNRIHYLNIGRDLSDKKGMILQLGNIYEGLAEAHAALNNHKLALEYYKKHIFYKDSLKGERDKNNVIELETRYQTTQKEKALTQQQLTIAKKEVQLRKSREMNVFSIGAALIALLVASLVFLHYRNKRRLHQQQLQTMQREKELQLLQAALEGEEKERSRIAKDLHDGVAGMLAAAKMQLGSLSIKNKELVEATEFVQAVKLLDDSCQEVRMTSHNLMPEILMQHGLSEAIRRFCENISNAHVLQVQYAAYGTIDRFTLNFELTVYRIVQELLNNIVKHSKATTATVQLSMQDDFLSITIEDNGVGFDKNKPMQSGTGLNSLQRRIQAMNGTLEIDAQHDQGVTAFIGIDISNYKR